MSDNVSKEFIEKQRIVEGALSVCYNDIIESNLIRILIHRRIAAIKLYECSVKSDVGKECLNIIKMCNHEIKQLLVI